MYDYFMILGYLSLKWVFKILMELLNNINKFSLPVQSTVGIGNKMQEYASYASYSTGLCVPES